MPPVLHAPSSVRFRAPRPRNLGSVTDHEELPAFDTGPGPPRAAFLIAYVCVVLAGLFGGAIDVSRGSTATESAIGAVVGAAVAAIGVGVVAVLALRAMAEWRRPPGAGTNDRRPRS